MAEPVLSVSARQPALAEMSYEEFLHWAEGPERAEWVDGKVIPMSPVSNLHQQVLRFLISVMTPFIENRNLGQLLFDPFQMKTGPQLPGRAPGMFFLKTANLARLKSAFCEGPADLVVEVVSPASRAIDRGEKFYEYEEGGVPEFWLIDPQRKEAEFFLLGTDRRYRAAPLREGAIYHSKALEGFWLKVAWLVEYPLPKVTDVLKELQVIS